MSFPAENRNSSERPIGIFDSGVGGLTVFRAIQQLLPQEHIVYLGDAARLPYGSKSTETVIRYTLECAHFLLKSNIKALVIACHTASSLSTSALKTTLHIPIIDMVQPCLPKLKLHAQRGNVAVIGTAATIGSNIYQNSLANSKDSLKVKAIACPLFAPLIEEGLAASSIARECIQHYLSPLKKDKVHALLLACTHYPLLNNELQAFMGDECTLLDPAYACAEAVRDILSHQDLLNISSLQGTTHFFTTDDANKFLHLGERFLSKPIGQVTKVII